MKFPEETREKVVARYLEGYGSTEIGREFGLSYATVIRWVHEAGYSKVEMKKLRLKRQLEKGEDKRGKMKKHLKRKLEQVEIYCQKITELVNEVKKEI